MTRDTFIIEGLAGAKKLSGTITVNGAKNAVLKAMSAAVLFEDGLTIANVPATEDVSRMSELMVKAGMKVVATVGGLELHAPQTAGTALDAEISKSMRSSVVVTGPMLARFGRVSFPAPGGCVIGARPVDLFIEGYKKLGAHVEEKDGMFHINVPGGRLVGNEIVFNLVTVGGTETLMMAAVLARGTTVLKNCAMEPEIVSLADFLSSCGAHISGQGTPTIVIEGVSELFSHGKVYETIPDRIEAGSFLFLAAALGDNVAIERCNPSHLEVPIALLRNSGVIIKTTTNSIEISENGKIKNADMHAFSVRTHEYPGFPTDLQSPLVAYLTQVSGESVVLETIFEGRFKFTDDFIKMGAKIQSLNPREIKISGPTQLRALPDGQHLQAHDIRAGFATVMAALLAEGKSTVNNVYYIDRGYEHLEERLTKLGANIQRVKS